MPEYVNRDNRIRIVRQSDSGVTVELVAGSVTEVGRQWTITPRQLTEYWTPASPVGGK